jgi:FkbM family methyltransferase
LLFDPLSSAIKIAQKNFEMNRISGEFHNVALGNFSGNSVVYLENNETFAYSVTVGKNLTGSKKVSAHEINVRRADEFIFHKAEIPNLIKMDVETFEPEVLRGFANLDLTNCLFLIEILSDEIGTQIQEILTPENFIYININDKIDKCRFQINLSKSDYYNFVLIPKKIYGKEHAQIMDFVKKFVS